MNYQNAELPEGSKLAGATPLMNQDEIPDAILNKHMAPKGKCGRLVVEEGACQFVWENDPENPLDCDPDHPVVIFPERFHRVVVTGPVKLKVEFYALPVTLDSFNPHAERPGENYI